MAAVAAKPAVSAIGDVSLAAAGVADGMAAALCCDCEEAVRAAAAAAVVDASENLTPAVTGFVAAAPLAGAALPVALAVAFGMVMRAVILTTGVVDADVGTLFAAAELLLAAAAAAWAAVGATGVAALAMAVVVGVKKTFCDDEEAEAYGRARTVVGVSMAMCDEDEEDEDEDDATGARGG